MVLSYLFYYSVWGYIIMIEEKAKARLPHNLIMEERKSAIINGVIDVDSFDEEVIVAYTDLGELTIKGNNLHISKLSLETGELSLDGEIVSLVYTDNKSSNGGFLSKLFR